MPKYTHFPFVFIHLVDQLRWESSKGNGLGIGNGIGIRNELFKGNDNVCYLIKSREIKSILFHSPL